MQSLTDLNEFLTRCESIGIDSCGELQEIAINEIKYLKGNDDIVIEALKKLERRWYDSLKINQPDYTVYDSTAYLAELWACWIVYSQRYLKLIHKFKTDNDSIFASVRSVVDVGCGIGYSTAKLSEIFPQARVYGTNIKNIVQWKIASNLASDFDFHMISSVKNLKSVDMIFASEYFEHIQKPIEHLREIIKSTQPKVLVIANSSSAYSIGHFNYYMVDSAWIHRTKISRLFNAEIKKLGYEKIKTSFWNGRPAIYIKD